MDDLWFNVLWTIIIAVATLLSDWIAAKFVISTRSLSAIQKSIDQANSDDRKLKEICDQLDRASKRAKSTIIWGADLVTVAIGLDLAILSLWITNKSNFPFFQHWNTETLNREIQVWLLVLVIHLVVLLLSIVFKHLHGDKIESAESVSPSKIWHWVPQNRWMLASNTLGFLALLSCFMIIKNSF